MKISKIVQIGLKTYKPKFKGGDKVTAEKVGYHNVMYVEGIDEYLTQMTGRLHYILCDVKYALGKQKTNNADPYAEDDLNLYTGKSLY